MEQSLKEQLAAQFGDRMVKVSFGGADVYVKRMNVAEFSDYYAKEQAIEAQEAEPVQKRLKLFALRVSDKDGNAVFDADNAEDLQQVAALPAMLFGLVETAFFRENYGIDLVQDAAKKADESGENS